VEKYGRDPAVVIVEPTEFFVVHNPYPQTTQELMLIENLRITSVQYTIVEAPDSCDSPGTLGWLSAAPNGGTIPGKGTREVTVVFASADLPPGLYTALLCVNTTDPQTPLIQVTVRLHVGPLPTATPTPVTPSATATAVPSSATPTEDIPTATPTGEPLPSETPTNTPQGATFTPTLAPPTLTPSVTNTPPPGATFTRTATSTVTPMTPTATATPPMVATSTATATLTPTMDTGTPAGNRLFLPMVRRR
jgi:hypothetical protein